MRIGVLGTGTVGKTVGAKLEELGHDVTFGSRSSGDYAEAAAHGELVVNATPGGAALEALRAAGAENLAGKVVIDISNPLDFSQGFPPTLTVCNDDSVAEQIQREFPDALVVKSLNTVTASVMVDPSLVEGSHTIFMAGDDDGAKGQVRELLQSFGWPDEDILDLGGVDAARGLEMYLPLWTRLYKATGTAVLNLSVRRPA